MRLCGRPVLPWVLQSAREGSRLAYAGHCTHQVGCAFLAAKRANEGALQVRLGQERDSLCHKTKARFAKGSKNMGTLKATSVDRCARSRPLLAK